MQKTGRRAFRLACTLAVTTALSGCGFLVRATEDCPTPGWGETKEAVLGLRGKPDKVVAATGNNEAWIYTLPTKNRWCGVMVFVLLPVPLILPVCDDSDRVEFAGERMQKSYKTRIHVTGVAVAPNMVDAGMDSCSSRRAGPAQGEVAVPTSTRRFVGLAGILEQVPKSEGRGCAPYNALVGNVYVREDGSHATVKRLLGESELCRLASRPIAVEFD